MPSSAAVGTCSQHMRVASGQVDQRCRLFNFGVLGMLPLRIRHRSMVFLPIVYATIGVSCYSLLVLQATRGVG